MRDGGYWYRACEALASHIIPGGLPSLKGMLEALRLNPTQGYPLPSGYGHLRICRLCIHAMDGTWADSAQDWKVYRRCSKHVAREFARLQVWS